METTTLLQLDKIEICREENVILRDASFTLHNGEFVYVIGKVGSGKSSLLKSLYCEIPIKQGEARLLDYNLRKIKRREIPYLRRKLGIVFQDFQLLTDRSVYKNLEFVLKATGWKRKKETAIPGTKPEAAAKPTAEPKESTAQSKAKNKKQKTISQPSEEKKGETGKPASTMDVLMAKKKKRNS